MNKPDNTFTNRLENRFNSTSNLLCIGLDISLGYIRNNLDGLNLFKVNQQIIDATSDLALCYKPQIAYYAAAGQEDTLKQTIDYIHTNYPDIPVILDAKRGDIGTTAEKYAEEAFVRYEADAVTVNPYMGIDAIAPFLNYEDKGTIVLARTSNPSSAFLLREIDGEPLYLHWAKHIVTQAPRPENIQFVVGATDLTAISLMRDTFPEHWLLVPGVGAQGGKVSDVITAAKRNENACPMTMINVSRGILPAETTIDNFADQVRELASRFAEDIRSSL